MSFHGSRNYLPTLIIIDGIPLFITFDDDNGRFSQYMDIYALKCYEKYIINNILNNTDIVDSINICALNINSDDESSMKILCTRRIDSFKKMIIDKNYEKVIDAIINKKMNKCVILLHGAPGNGKSTFALYYAIKFKKDLSTIKIDKELRAFDLMNELIENEETILLIDDIDTIFDNKSIKKDYKIDTSILLEIFDGKIFKKAIIFVTTNHVDALPDNLLRNKRIDLSLEIKVPSNKIVDEICAHYKYIEKKDALYGKSMAEIDSIVS